MTLLKFFLEWGKNGLGAMWLLPIGLLAFFIYQYVVARKSGGVQQVDTATKPVHDNKKTPWYRIHITKYIIAILVFTGLIHWLITCDYSEKKSKKIPATQTDTTRLAPDDFNK